MTDRHSPAFIDDNGDDWTFAEVAKVHTFRGDPPLRLMSHQKVRFITEDRCVFCQMHGLPDQQIHGKPS